MPKQIVIVHDAMVLSLPEKHMGLLTAHGIKFLAARYPGEVL